jgi:hypothetical protein
MHVRAMEGSRCGLMKLPNLLGDVDKIH